MCTSWLRSGMSLTITIMPWHTGPCVPNQGHSYTRPIVYKYACAVVATTGKTARNVCDLGGHNSRDH